MLNIRRAAALGLAAAVLAIAGIAGAGAQANDVIMRVAATTEESVKEGDTASFDVTIENVENFGAFQFVLQYDPDVFEYANFTRGEFLGSTGREVVCNDPQTDEGTVLIACNTLRPSPDGPNGNGLLATIELKATGSGSTDITLSRTKVAQPDGTEVPNAVENTTIEVEGSSSINWMIWGPAIAVVIGIIAVLAIGFFIATRRRGSGHKEAPAT